MEAVATIIALFSGIHRSVATEAKHTVFRALSAHDAGSSGTFACYIRTACVSGVDALRRTRECKETGSRAGGLLVLARCRTSVIPRTIAIVALLACGRIKLSVAAEIRLVEFAGDTSPFRMIAFLFSLHVTIAAGDRLRALRCTENFLCRGIDLILQYTRIVTAIHILLAADP